MNIFVKILAIIGVLFLIQAVLSSSGIGSKSTDTAALEAQKSVAKDPGLGLTYAQAIRGLDAYIPEMESFTLGSGERSMRGMANPAEALVTLEIIGEPESINRANIVTGIVKESEAINIGTIGCMMIFLHNTMPEFKDGIKWVDAAVKRIVDENSGGEEIVRGEKKLKLTVIKSLGMVLLSVEHKDRKEPG